MTKYIDSAFGSALARPVDQDLAGRNLADAHAKLHQLPLDPDRFGGPEEFRLPVVPVETDADRMDYLMRAGWSESTVCRMSKYPGVLEGMCYVTRVMGSLPSGMSKAMDEMTPKLTPKSWERVAAVLASEYPVPDGAVIFAQGTFEPSAPVKPAAAIVEAGRTGCGKTALVHDCHRRAVAASAIAPSEHEGIVLYDHGVRGVASPAMEHSTLSIHDKLEDDLVMLQRLSPAEVYRYLGTMAREGSAAVREANAEGLRRRFGPSRAAFAATTSTASSLGPDGSGR